MANLKSGASEKMDAPKRQGMKEQEGNKASIFPGILGVHIQRKPGFDRWRKQASLNLDPVL